VARAGEPLTTKCKAFSPNPSPPKKTKKQKTKKTKKQQQEKLRKIKLLVLGIEPSTL
jgi:hypothetical protein